MSAVDLARLVKPLKWTSLASSFMAEDHVFNTIAITADTAKYDADRAARVLAALDGELLAELVDALELSGTLFMDKEALTAFRAILAKLGVQP